MFSPETLRDQRTKLGLSQSALARTTGVSRFKLNDYESGGKTLSADEIQRIEHALSGRANVLRERLRTLDLAS